MFEGLWNKILSAFGIGTLGAQRYYGGTISWALSQDDHLPYSERMNCGRKYSGEHHGCRDDDGSTLVTVPMPDGSRKIYLPFQIDFTQRQQMSWKMIF